MLPGLTLENFRQLPVQGSQSELTSCSMDVQSSPAEGGTQRSATYAILERLIHLGKVMAGSDRGMSA